MLRTFAAESNDYPPPMTWNAQVRLGTPEPQMESASPRGDFSACTDFSKDPMCAAHARPPNTESTPDPQAGFAEFAPKSPPRRRDHPAANAIFILETATFMLETVCFMLETRSFMLETVRFRPETAALRLETIRFMFETVAPKLETGSFRLEREGLWDENGEVGYEHDRPKGNTNAITVTYFASLPCTSEHSGGDPPFELQCID